jgi:REP element-mobilizing transposase RayT
MKKFPERKANRLRGFDYSSDGAYFVTICTKNCKSSLSEIENGKPILTLSGKIVEKHWFRLEKFYKNLTLDSYVIMPNHFHGTLFIDNSNLNPDDKRAGLSDFMRSFKSFSSKEINSSLNIGFQWQKSFYDVIIRDDTALTNIRSYIDNNPINWLNDKYYS